MAKERKLRTYDAVVELPARPSLRRLPFPIPEASDKSPAKPVYLVVEHEVEKPAYSLFKVDSAGSDGPGDGDGHAKRLPGHLARLHEAKHGMSFVAAHSQLGSWIVGVGGATGSWGRDTVIYDLKTSEEICGPFLESAKSQPILLSVRGRVYAMSRCPAVNPRHEFEPWFEVLDLNEPSSMKWSGSWRSLPSPPCFPCSLTELEYNDPPEVCVTSYAVVDSHILVSLDIGNRIGNGTYAFDVEVEVWEQVQYKNLPFIGQAVPVVGCLFVSHSKKTDALTLYEMEIQPSSYLSERMLRIITIMELPVAASEPITPCQFFCSLGKGSRFSSFGIKSIDPVKNAKSKRGTIVRWNYLMEDAPMFDPEPEFVKVKRWKQVYKVFDRSRQLARPVPLVAALTLGTE